MLNEQTIRSAVDRAVAAAHAPSKVIVFGSYGRGDADEGSDLDLLVVEREVPDRLAEYSRIRGAIGRIAPGVGVDVLVCDSTEFERRRQVPSTVFYWASKEGRVLYDAAA
ncbi:MAG: nucleotidyltransferase domain-containing protein [Betaproteobacteria bacterium]|nr:nucleotidyltransferase domain-containing protein [Betaproteobacteria bacterium]